MIWPNPENGEPEFFDRAIGCEHVEDIDQRYDSGRQRDRFADLAVWVAATVILFMVIRHEVEGMRKQLFALGVKPPAAGRQDFGADSRVLAKLNYFRAFLWSRVFIR